jgi:F420-dependent oxidoreductase-like protein
MRFALMTEPQQGMTYADQLAIARRAEAAGFEAFFRSDHFASFPGPAGRPTTDAWTVLAGLARETQRIRLGVLVSPVTFRLPGVLAKIAATVDEMSGGRVELGLGAGWNEDEHRQYGIPFPPIEDRAAMLEEGLQIVHGLWDEPHGWSFAGSHFRVDDALFAAKPAGGTGPGRPRIIIGGDGMPRSMRMAARWADEFNLSGATPERAVDRFARLDDACRAIGRDPASLTRSVMVGVLVGRDQTDVERRTAALLELVGADVSAEEWFVPRRARWIYGTPDEARETIGRYAAAGVERLMLQDLLPWDLEMVDLLGKEIVGRV